jgi:hypothetical protein
LQVQVPPPEPQLPLLPPVDPPAPVAPPSTPPVPTTSPLPPVPQSHLQGGQASPGRQAGQLQLHVPPPVDEPPPTVGNDEGGQLQLTAGQLPLAGQATGWRHPHPFPVTPRVRQNPDEVQSCPTGQRAGIVSVPCEAVQAHRVSPEQARESV